MPTYDRVCGSCGAVKEDLFEPIGKSDPIPCECGGSLKRSIATGKFHKSSGITPDLIPGGLLVKHGICNPDGTPRRYDSKSEMQRVAKDFGVEPMVRHVGLPGSDKNPHTVRWDAPPPITEEERKRAWWEHERANGFAPPKPLVRGDYAIRDRTSEIIADAILQCESSGFSEQAFAEKSRV